MPVTAPAFTPASSTAILDRVRELYQQGLSVQAYQAGKELGTLAQWPTTAGRLMAGRLAVNLGAPQLGFRLHLAAWRADRSEPEACYYYARALLDRRGPLRAWRFLRQVGDLPDAPAEIRADWYAYHACVLGLFRDFDAAESWLERAELICPERPWICIERAHLLELEDRCEESLRASQRALELRPWYRPGVQAVAHSLQLLGRDDEALALLREADRHIENCLVVLQRAALEVELKQYAEAAASYERFLELAPLVEEELKKWLAARCSDAAYYLGHRAAAAEFARQAKDEKFYDKLAERLESDQPAQRVLLDVPFVRQNHQTCAPATLVSISRFWKMPAEHLEVAASICYDGTYDHRERRWAEEQGWAVREFAVTWEAATTLIDRGMPFTLTTLDPLGGHLQAVMGYDSLRRTLLVRDPGQRIVVEFLADQMLEQLQASGPRGMVLVPKEKAALLDGIALPDADQYDRVYRLQRAIDRHQREQAAQVLVEMKECDPQHRLTLQGGRLLGLYDSDRTAQLDCIEQLLLKYPDDAILQLSKLAFLRELARRDERLALYESICARKESHPIFRRQFAQELIADAREHARAFQLLNQALRRLPLDVGNYAVLSELLRSRRRFDEALEIDRFAACLNDKDEGLAQNYFITARYLKQTEAALRWLRQRFDRFGKQSSQPARTLYSALSQCERLPEGLRVIDQALELRPHDGELMLFAADCQGDCGRFERAAGLLKQADGRCPRLAWLHSAARLAELRGDGPGALALWRQVIAAEPLGIVAHRALCRLLHESEGRASVLAHLEQFCLRFPCHLVLNQLRLEWLREDGPTALEPMVRAFIQVHPNDAWGHRELALVLSDQGRHAEALEEIERSRHLEPPSVTFHAVHAQVLEQAGHKAEAQEAYRQTILLSVDNDFAIGRLIGLCDNLAQRRAALQFVEAELIRQTIYGDGLLAFQFQARNTLEPTELLAALRAAHAARPDLWHAWSALVRQLGEMGQLDEALQLAHQAAERFPFLPKIWLDLAYVCDQRKERVGQRNALEQALQISPNWGMAIRELAELHRREGNLPRVRELLEQAIVRAPLDCYHHAMLADVLWDLKEKEAAIARIQHAIRLEPGFEPAWRRLRQWAHELNRPELALDAARDLTVRRKGEARSWLILAETLHEPAQQEERLAALNQAIAVNPRLVDAYDLKAELLAQRREFDAARAACQAEALGPPPINLRGRLAWIEAQAGNLVEAMAAMRAVLAEDPAYYWGWSQLAEWCQRGQMTKDYLEAAEHMVRLTPDNPVAYGQRGEARIALGDRAGGKADYAKAMELAPDYVFAPMSLFDEQMADDDLAGAERTTKFIETNGPPEYAALRRVQLAARRKQRGQAQEAFQKLLLVPAATPWSFDTAAAALEEAGWPDLVESCLAEALPKPDANPHVGAMWAGRVYYDEDTYRRIVRHAGQGPLWQEALIGIIRRLGDAQARDELRRYYPALREQLGGNTRAWSVTGFALSNCGLYAEAARWMADWQQRPGLASWMLLNQTIALRGCGRDAEAGPIHQHALTLPPDETTRFHRLWLAFDHGLAGTPVPEETLADIPTDLPDHAHRFLLALVQVLGILHQTEDRSAVFGRLRHKLADAARASTPLTADRPVIQEAYRKVVRKIGADCGTLAARLWAWWRCQSPLLPAEK